MDNERSSQADTGGTSSLRGVWSPDWSLATIAFCFLRMYAAVSTCILDCDETYNYWEPLHYLLYGTGFQTWEYSPEYALRNYSYLVPFAIVGEFLRTFGLRGDKVFVFYGIKACCGLLCGFAEGLMYRGIQVRFGKRPASYFLLFQLLSAGMFNAGVALLPTSTCMALTMLVYAGWMTRNYRLAIYAGLASVLVPGWPFVAVLYVPFALAALVDLWAQRRFFWMVGWGLLALASLAAPVFLTERRFYGRDTMPAWNIFRYNVLSAREGRGDELYGVEPASYYLKNLFLNLNVGAIIAFCFPLAALAGLLSRTKALRSEARARALFLSPLALWLGIMFAKPHKEERFLYPVYPLVYLAAAFVLDGAQRWAEARPGDDGRGRAAAAAAAGSGGGGGWARCSLGAGALVLAGLLSMARTAAVLRNYSAPCRLWEKFYYRELPPAYRRAERAWDPAAAAAEGGGGPPPPPPPPPGLTVARAASGTVPSRSSSPGRRCTVGFLPPGSRELPQPGARRPPCTLPRPAQPFNDLNREEPARYTELRRCDYVQEFVPAADEGGGGGLSALARQIGQFRGAWEQRWAAPFLDPGSTGPGRAFLLPAGLSPGRVAMGRQALFRR
ncbi:unnamed protein product, partial [Heterosigma akashiwo]